jgi:RimJ/RimL family protein N-acetyltransferase
MLEPGFRTMLDLTPCVLESRHVRLEPLAREHTAHLRLVALDPELWRFTPTQIHSGCDLDGYIEAAVSAQRSGTALPFATIDRATGRAVGSTRFANLDRPNRRVELGWSWLGREFQRTALNTDAKLLMLTHAFERMSCIRVELRADVLNTKSRNAIARLGANEEGVLRQHTILPGGRVIDWVYYSILSDEWPSVRAGLEQKLAGYERHSY